MPTVFKEGPYRFFFFSNEGSEPVHIHAESSGNYAKLWFGPVRVASSVGFRPYELSEMRSIIESNIDLIVVAME